MPPNKKSGKVQNDDFLGLVWEYAYYYKFIYCKMLYTNKSEWQRESKFQKSRKAWKKMFFSLYCYLLRP